jgi:hypothetical protein
MVNGGREMVVNLTRTAFIEDCISILLATDKICEDFKEVTSNHALFAQFGQLRRADDSFALPLLERYREDWDSHRTMKEEVEFRSAPLVPKTQSESILAVVLGWLCHRVAESMLPIEEEAGFYQDAVLFRSLYVRSEAEIESAALSDLFQVMQQRYFIEMHTFIPDGEDIEGWFDSLYANMQEWNTYMERFALAVAKPDVDKERSFVTDRNFYKEEDAIIALTRKLRSGLAVSQDQIDEAIASTPISQYARALKMAVDNLLLADAFFTKKTNQIELELLH